ncbi:hypothetical protein CYLTODRAFT_433868 [Cylindrobasidium torrendii FP15055 ss-10]|uniref:Casein kinase II subunit beta n=1 Tax=Cylindrobasidium torrendii FP15055 ss-10 TaxID=1314674 RepID=A0A0D7BWX5_9AGAR|nr:hypothetical protein CYLTODRAFT_433868 [Cylindrobasidium torrendii FP15055 ss-10]
MPRPADPDPELQEDDNDDDEIMDDQEDGYTSSTTTSTVTWISWFCSLPGHEYFCEVTEDFIEDDFNLTGLNVMVPFWKEAMEMVMDIEPDEDAATKIPDVSIVESSAEMLYGLVHQRFILTRAGLQAMIDKYENNAFGVCPRVLCRSSTVVPCGRSDLPGLDTVKLYCPNCNDIYVPPSSRYQGVDGAFFGTTFAHLFFQSYRELAPAPFYKPPPPPSSTASSPSSNASAIEPASEAFVNPNPYGGQKRAEGAIYYPRIYGFKVSERAKSGPRMQWMRVRPESPEQLDRVDWRGHWIGEYSDDDDDDEDGGEMEMQDFDPDVTYEDDDDEEEEEEEEMQAEPPRASGSRRMVGAAGVVQSARTAPTAAGLRPPAPVKTQAINIPRIASSGQVRVVRQYIPAAA